MLEHEVPQGNLGPVQSLVKPDSLGQIGLQGLVVDLPAHRIHDDYRHENGQTGQNLGGRHLLDAHGLTQKMKDDDNAGEAGHRHHDGGRQRQHGEQKKNFQSQRNFFGLARAPGQSQLQGGDIPLSGRRQARDQEQRQKPDAQRRQRPRSGPTP